LVGWLVGFFFFLKLETIVFIFLCYNRFFNIVTLN